ncbi:MAG: glycerol-3-phosphate 1-O-acyltransferase PlsY [Deinococcales bacterium]
MLDIVVTVIFMVIGYLIGTIPTGYLVAKARGVDIQTSGSGNIGATNVMRTLGVLPALIVVVVDPLKAAAAVLLPTLLGVGAWTVSLTGLATVLGNNFNIMLRLRGGKGIATTLGVFLVINPLVTGLCVVIGVFTILLSRYVSLGSMVGLFAAPLFLIAGLSYPMPHLYLAVVLAALAILRHRDNIRRLIGGTERRLGERAHVRPKDPR